MGSGRDRATSTVHAGEAEGFAGEEEGFATQVAEAVGRDLTPADDPIRNETSKKSVDEEIS